MGNGLPGQVGFFSSKACLVDFRDCDPYKHSSSLDIASPLQFLTLCCCLPAQTLACQYLCNFKVYNSASQSVVPGPAVSASPENLSEVYILGLHSTSTESQTLGGGPRDLHLNKPSKGVLMHLQV